MNRIPSAPNVGVRVTPYPTATKRKAEENERERATNAHSRMDEETHDSTSVIRLLIRELSPFDHQLTGKEASVSDDASHFVDFPMLGDEYAFSAISSEVEEYSPDFAADASSFGEDADYLLPLSELTQRFEEVSSSPEDDEKIPSSIPLENTSEINHENAQTRDVVEIRGGVFSAGGQWVADPEPTNGVSSPYKYKLKNIDSEDDVEFCLEFDSPPSKGLASNPTFFIRNGKEWFVYVGEKAVYLYLLESSGLIAKQLEYKIENITAFTISSNGKYFAAAGFCNKESAVFVYQIDGLNDSCLPEKFLSKLNKFKIKNINLSSSKKFIAVAGAQAIGQYIIYNFSIESEEKLLYSIKSEAPIDHMSFEKTGRNYGLRVKFCNNSNYYVFPINLTTRVTHEPTHIFAQDSFIGEDLIKLG